MSAKRDLNQELFGNGTTSQVIDTKDSTREVSLSKLADLSELAEEQAKVRVKVTHLSTSVAALTDSVEHTDHRLDKLREALKGTVSQVEQLSAADNLHSQQLGTLSDSLQNLESQLEAHGNALAFLRNSDGQQQQSIERLKQSRITLTHVLLFGIFLCAGAAFAFDVDKAFSFHQRLNQIEHRLHP
ncbi:hypothetical protein [cf. Phormidesmis sp. LEGE 11477]|uniref:hypothetical protein n=1 Tax=cf. Phormidesmis sp. LEGE 11477 TaxID=1828680 RepID=UPI00187EABAF|nr:hypothetical protein [cf. Phormidesmis sp. LEGE 11477]MBE9063201.1 hypothetical protein [cf. Phormidesmis sp. LEGE 11477]